ncbi:acyl-CoA synthetase [Zavarzinia compransoris]|uniref:3-methylmercaptopropionyl-CoA ligase n=1 Tax=Zavarzinia compransoris TaxID=1264899 RepID=A0A317DWV6_9PROT|nr:long-chain fatty acid--CoA ligase [Zavarzinia compransoris]PWR18346.1 fatty-acid--CoA ligase [Zavarzinia compransoris]TDP43592.1 acyl-CoA synthetase (AMP-forming)/AMP-acid ligase II [Zavarzinia compransoris]
MYITQPLHRAVQQHPDKVALRCGRRSQTFRSMADRVARLAGALQALGMAPGDRVAMLALNSDRYFEYMIAVPWGGGVINPCNIRWSAAELLYSLEDSGSRLLLVDDAFAAVARRLQEDSSQPLTVIYAGDGAVPAGMLGYEALIAGAQPVPDAVRRGDDLFGLFYTGGTTGQPKGVMISHGGMYASLLSMLAEGMAPRDGVYLHAAPMFHVADIGMSGIQWLRGNTQCFIGSFTPQGVVEAIERDRATHVLLVPTMIQMLVDHPAMREGRDLSSLRCIVYGASPIAEPVLDRAMAVLPGVEFVQAYGMTELSPLATICPAEFHTVEGRRRGKLRSAGRASFCTEIRIVNAEGREVPRGTVGEVAVRGPNVMKGYWNNPDLTAATVRDGWMHTGDGAYMDDDGFIFIVDRVKDMIISGGENVYSAEVENVVAQHPAVAAGAVIGIPSAEWGESVHAVVVLKPGAALTGEDLIRFCKDRIAGYKCPRSVDIVAELPLSGAGKVLKTALRAPYWKDRESQVA